MQSSFGLLVNVGTEDFFSVLQQLCPVYTVRFSYISVHNPADLALHLNYFVSPTLTKEKQQQQHNQESAVTIWSKMNPDWATGVT